MTELAHIDLFLTEATTSVIVESFLTKRKVAALTTDKKALIEPGEIISVNSTRFKKRYKVNLLMDSEATMVSVINEIIDATVAYNRRDGTLTEVAIMCNIKFVYSSKGSIVSNNRWKQDIYLDIEWVTS